VRVFTGLERTTKGALFGCRMCGNCVLQETAFVCPMTCPKGLRNGLCGDASPEHCSLDPSRPCTWYMIYDRAERMGRLDRLLEINAPVDGMRAGHETWLDALKSWRKGRAQGEGPRPLDFFVNRARFNDEWERFFHQLRQPSWWEGDSAYHPAAYTEPISGLEARLRAGEFVVTAEIAPPMDASTEQLNRKISMLAGSVAAANFTDNSSATARMSSLACSKLSLDAGLEPVMQLQARDRTRVAIQSDVMGASALGIRNILCLSGDHHGMGPAPVAKPDQFDLDAVQLLWVLRRMRDEGKYLDGRTIKERPRYFLGAAASPFGAPPKYEAIRAEKKINAGAQFIQTQPVFDYGRFLDWLEALDRRNLLDKVYVLPGISPLKSANGAHMMVGRVPGISIPPDVLKRMDEAGEKGDKQAQQETGIQMALEIIEKLRATPGIHGLHIMTMRWEEVVPTLVEQGLVLTALPPFQL
jgi:methylenetetrahydrofolate reductase (NADPH)